VLYRSPQVFLGYWAAPKETEDAFVDGWFRSGDLARRDDAGYIYVVDRLKDVINTGGVLVASREVEDAIYLHDAVREVAVIATDDEKWIEAITAVVVPRRPVSAEEIQAHVRGVLAPFKVPKRVIFVENLPRSAAGKVLKAELRHAAANLSKTGERSQ
jgi:fatty-acyl-CoA synthase